MDQRSPLAQRPLHVRDRRQPLVLDLDQLSGVVGDVPVLRYHHRHRLPVVPDLLRSQRHSPRDVAARVRADGPRIPRHLLRREDGHHSPHPLGPADVDRPDPRVGNPAPDEGRVQHAGNPQVVEERPCACHEPPVLNPRNGSAHVPWRRERPAQTPLPRTHCSRIDLNLFLALRR